MNNSCFIFLGSGKKSFDVCCERRGRSFKGTNKRINGQKSTVRV